MNSCAWLLGSDGPFAGRYAQYEPRSTQIQMATAIARAIAEERVLLCEAGTGTGKTMAYLVPALCSGKKVIVSTATRALQEQIVNHDLPWIAEALGISPSVAVMKGLSNYVCRRRLHEQFRASSARGRISNHLRLIMDFAQASHTGDISHIDDLGEESPELADVTSSSDTRVGSTCQYYDSCFVTQMRRQAERAQLVVVNHHLYFADLALRGPHPGRILPNYDVIVFDEAHQIEDIATEFFGIKVSSQSLLRMLRELSRAVDLAHALGFGNEHVALENLTIQLKAALEEFFNTAAQCTDGSEGRCEVDVEMLQAQAKDAWLKLDTLLEGVGALVHPLIARFTGSRGAAATGSANVRDALDIGARRITESRSRLQELMESSRGRVVWTERTARGASLTSSPIDLADLLKDKVFDTIPTVVLTSATLTAFHRPHDDNQHGQFEYVRQRLGIVDLMGPVDELVVPSTFDFKHHALLYTPRDLPAPNSGDFLDRAAERIIHLIDITRGGAFILTTSIRSMHVLHERLSEHVKLPLLLQGTLAKAELLRRFRATGNAVLVATSSFWEGVDVAGSALRLVVLEKIPFLVPSDPLVRARSLALEAQGRSPFNEYALPAAAIALKQGFGRLIRSSHDKGIVALLDERVHRRGYGQRLLSSLPPAQRTNKLEDVRQFWAALA